MARVKQTNEYPNSNKPNPFATNAPGEILCSMRWVLILIYYKGIIYDCINKGIF